MTDNVKLIDIIDDLNFMIVRFVEDVDPQRIEEWDKYIKKCEIVITDEDNVRIGSELRYDEDDVFGHWERILQSILTNQTNKT